VFAEPDKVGNPAYVNSCFLGQIIDLKLKKKKRYSLLTKKLTKIRIKEEK
jgi:hypothetical protein